MKHLKVPTDLIAAPFNNKALQMNGLSVVDSCFYNEKTVGSMFLEEHIIFYVLKGQATLSHCRKKHIVKKDEFVLLKRATMYGFIKEGNIIGTESAFHGLLFCLKDEILLDFIRMANIHREATDSYKLAVRQANGRLKAFTESLMPYFDDSMNIDDGLLKLKIMELLYDVIHSDNQMQQQILMLGQPTRKNINEVMEENFLNPVSVPELAYLSGRSLSSFKREFQELYHIPPTLWIRQRRLEHARHLLETTDASISEICYISGFENPTHFTRLFKELYGKSPSSMRKA